MSPLLTVNEAAEFLKVTPATVYRLTKSGALPCVRIGRSVRLAQDALEELMQPSAQERADVPTPTHAPVIKL